MEELKQDSESLPRAIRWSVRLIVLLLLIMIGWVLEDRYGLFSRADVRIKVTRLAEEIDSDGQPCLVFELDVVGLESHLYVLVHHDDSESSGVGAPGNFPETSLTSLSTYAVKEHFQHLVRPRYARIKIELPLRAPASLQAVTRVGQLIRLRRGDRIVIAKYRTSGAISSDVDKDQELELSLRIE